MKFLLLASFAIICTASTVYRNRNISVNDDGNILITSPNGKRVVISRQEGVNGQRKIDIDISGPNIESKRIQVQDNRLDEAEIGDGNTPWSSIDSVSEESRLKRGSIRGKSQGDILSDILREYQGVVDESQYEKLMVRIGKAVKKGEINPQVYDLLEELDQQQQQRIGVQGDVPFGQDVEQQRRVLLGGMPVGLQRGYEGSIVDLPRTQSQVVPTQDPTGRYLYTRGGQYLTTRYVNPLLQRTLPQRGFIDDLLVGQQLGGVQTGFDRLGNQIVQQRTLTGLGANQVLKQLYGYQQIPYDQQILANLRRGPQIYGARQTIDQVRDIPQTFLQQQQQQQIELGEVEEVLDQLERVEQQLQQRQFLQQQQQQVELQQTVDVIEKLSEIQQREEQQIVDLAEELNEIQRETVDVLRGVRQPVTQQFYKQQQPIARQFYGQQQPIMQQLYGQRQQLYGQQGPLYGEQQQLYGQRQQLYGQQRPLYGEQQQLYGQQQQLYGQRQPIVQQWFKQQQPIAQQWYRQQQTLVPQLYRQQQPMVDVMTGQQLTGQIRSVPLTLQQLMGIPRSITEYRGTGLLRQPILRGLGSRSIQPVQDTTTRFVNTLPQVQLVY